MINNTPLVSVIVPVYNVEDYVEKCINSITKQSYNNLEIILVNDGSTDNSQKICINHQKNDSRIIVINKKNGGLSDARNTGIDIAKGDYLAFVDSDDYIHSDMIKTMISSSILEQSDIVICGHFSVNKDEISEIRNDGEKYSYNSKEALIKILIDEEINSFAWDKIYKKELFKGLRYPLGRIFEDTAFTYKLFEKANKITQLNNSYYYYLKRDESLTNVYNPKKYYHNFLAFYERYLFSKNNLPEVKLICCEKVLQHGMNIIDNSIVNKKNECKDFLVDTKNKLSDVLKDVNISKLKNSTLKTKLFLYSLDQKTYQIIYSLLAKLKS